MRMYERSHFCYSVRSPQWLRSKWWALKRHVTNYQNLPLREILDTLSALLVAGRKLRPAGASQSVTTNSKLSSTGTTTFRLCNSSEGYTLTTAAAQLPGSMYSILNIKIFCLILQNYLQLL